MAPDRPDAVHTSPAPIPPTVTARSAAPPGAAKAGRVQAATTTSATRRRPARRSCTAKASAAGKPNVSQGPGRLPTTSPNPTVHSARPSRSPRARGDCSLTGGRASAGTTGDGAGPWGDEAGGGGSVARDAIAALIEHFPVTRSISATHL